MPLCGECNSQTRAITTRGHARHFCADSSKLISLTCTQLSKSFLHYIKPAQRCTVLRDGMPMRIAHAPLILHGACRLPRSSTSYHGGWMAATHSTGSGITASEICTKRFNRCVRLRASAGIVHQPSNAACMSVLGAICAALNPPAPIATAFSLRLQHLHWQAVLLQQQCMVRLHAVPQRRRTWVAGGLLSGAVPSLRSWPFLRSTHPLVQTVRTCESPAAFFICEQHTHALALSMQQAPSSTAAAASCLTGQRAA